MKRTGFGRLLFYAAWALIVLTGIALLVSFTAALADCWHMGLPWYHYLAPALMTAGLLKLAGQMYDLVTNK